MRRGVKEINRLYCQFREEKDTKTQVELWERIERLAKAPGVVKDSDYGTLLKVPEEYKLKRGGEAEPFITVGPEGMSVTRVRHGKSISNPQKWGFREEFLRALDNCPYIARLYRSGQHRGDIFHRMEYIPGKMCKDRKEAGTILHRVLDYSQKKFHAKLTLTDVGIKNTIQDIRRKHPVYVDFLLRPPVKKVPPRSFQPQPVCHGGVKRHPHLRRPQPRKKQQKPVTRHLEKPRLNE